MNMCKTSKEIELVIKNFTQGKDKAQIDSLVNSNSNLKKNYY